MRQLANPCRDRRKLLTINEAFYLKPKTCGHYQMVAEPRKVMKLNRAQSLLKTGRIQESLAEHAAVMAALTSWDAAAAQVAMRAHIESGQEASG